MQQCVTTLGGGAATSSLLDFLALVWNLIERWAEEELVALQFFMALF